MIRDKVRKEICLLLILTLIVSLASGQTAYAAETETSSVSDTEVLLTEPTNNEPDINIPSIENPTGNPDTNGDFAKEDQNNLPAIVNDVPILNVSSLNLIAGGNSYDLYVKNARNVSYALPAGDTSIVTLSNETIQSVTITPKSLGNTILSVTATGNDGTQTILTCQITVSELSLSKESVEIYMNDADHSADVAIQGVDLDTIYYDSGNEWAYESASQNLRESMIYGNQCSIRAGNDQVADASFSMDGSIHIEGIAKGITNIKLNIYGFSLSVRVKVNHYTLNKYTINTYKGSANKILKLKGAGEHKITWVSGNKNVASVSNNGTITIHGIGTTKITAKVNGRKVVCIVSVSSKTAYRVVKNAREISNKKNIQYSQALRMSSNFYDCSSLVYRCYRVYGIRFGYTHPSWAPTAADEGRWCATTNHLISTGAVDILSCKMAPGDTIYYSFNENNGRYLNIDHTAIFAGYAYDESIGHYGTVIEASSSSNTVTERMYYAGDSIKLIGRPSKK